MAPTPDELLDIRARLTGQAQVIAGMDAMGAASMRLRRQIESSAEATHLETVAYHAKNQALFTMRRLVYGASIAFGAAAVGVVAFGLKFNSSMQQNMVAFTHFLGSAQAAQAYIDKLYDLAAHTPFEFVQLTNATKKLMAFGFTADTAYRTMVDIGDAAAGLGVGAEGIDRMAYAFGQMLTNGRILGGELRQLSEVGINARKYLQEAFNLTPDQMANIGALHIDSRKGIEAILAGMEKEFGGFARAQSQTFQGLLSTIHDYAQKLFGTITKPLFDKLSTDYLPRLAKFTQMLSDAFEQGGWTGMIKAMDDATGAGGKLLLVWGRLSSIANSIWVIVTKQLWPAFLFGLKVISPLLALLWPLSWILQLVADHTTIATFAFKLLVTYLLITRVALVLLGKSWMLLNGAMWRGALFIGLKVIPALRSLVFWTYASNRAANGQFQKMGWLRKIMQGNYSDLIKLRAATLRYAMSLLVASRAAAVFLLTNPVGWAILIISTLAILYMKWQWFHDKVNAIFFWIKDHWPLLAGIFLGPFAATAYVIYKLFDFVWGKVKWVWDKAQAIAGWVRDTFGWLFGDGGGQVNAVNAVTNMNQPNRMPTRIGALPTPAKATKTDLSQVDTGDRTILLNNRLEVNKKVLAEQVAEYKLYKDARR